MIPRVRLGYLASIQSGITVDGKRSASFDDVTLPYLRVANVQDGHLDLGDITEIRVPRSLARSATLKSGDVLMTEGGDLTSWGVARSGATRSRTACIRTMCSLSAQTRANSYRTTSYSSHSLRTHAPTSKSQERRRPTWHLRVAARSATFDFHFRTSTSSGGSPTSSTPRRPGSTYL